MFIRFYNNRHQVETKTHKMKKAFAFRGLLACLAACLILVGCSGDTDATPRPTETPRPSSRVVVPGVDSQSFEERLEQWLSNLETRTLAAFDNIDSIQETALTIYPIQSGSDRQPNYAIFVLARLTDASADRQETARALLTRTQGIVETNLSEFSALLNVGESYTNYRWSSVTNSFAVDDLTAAFANHTGEIAIDVDNLDFQVSFPTELHICPRNSCAAVGNLPRGSRISLGDPVSGESVLGRQDWYVADYFGLPVYLPFARVVRARN
jgi:hypothetical protein